jgi:hypothetical protein
MNTKTLFISTSLSELPDSEGFYTLTTSDQKCIPLGVWFDKEKYWAGNPKVLACYTHWLKPLESQEETLQDKAIKELTEMVERRDGFIKDRNDRIDYLEKSLLENDSTIEHLKSLILLSIQKAWKNGYHASDSIYGTWESFKKENNIQ